MKKFFWAAMFALCVISMSAQTTDDDERVRQRIQTAVMNVYDNALAENPDDYNTRFARANQLFLNGDYAKAIADADIVVSQVPKKENELKFDTYLLKARAQAALEQYEDEVETLQAAAAINPKSMALIDLMGKASYNLGDMDAAEQNFKMILRDTPMNYDAHYWLARVELARNNFGKAYEYSDKAVSLFTANPQVYLNRSDILMRSQQYEQAAQDLISAMSVGNDEGASMRRLIAMSDEHYDDVMNVLASSIDKAPQVGMFHYLRAIIGIRQNHYGQALRNLDFIVDNNLYDYHSIYYYRAQCQFALTKYADALVNINKAIAMNESANADYYVLKAQCEQNLKTFEAATMTLDQAAKLVPNNQAVLLEQARLLSSRRADKEAQAKLAALLAINPKNAEALLLKGWIEKYRQNNAGAANRTFEQVLACGDDMSSLRGFALHELGRNDEARAWANQIIQDNRIIGGQSYFLASALLSDIGDYEAGDKTKSMEYLRSALANGYGNLHEIKVNETPYVNLKLVRRYPDFQTTLDQNQLNFEIRR
ncbi:MAG: tetratricopeptide repeat protein [Muribaculaceae bacterium]|nr:tetratricopeptide repeat protein [Muribaculaceae bacterium]